MTDGGPTRIGEHTIRRLAREEIREAHRDADKRDEMIAYRAAALTGLLASTPHESVWPDPEFTGVSADEYARFAYAAAHPEDETK